MASISRAVQSAIAIESNTSRHIFSRSQVSSSRQVCLCATRFYSYNQTNKNGRRQYSTPTPDSTSTPVIQKSVAKKEVALTSETYPNIKRDERFSKVITNILVKKEKRNKKGPSHMENHKANRLIQLTKEDVEYFKSILSSPSGVIETLSSNEAKADLDGFNTDWIRKYKGKSQLVLKPKTTQEVSDIMKHCYKRKLAVVPQGGNTGLVGGSVPVFDEIVVSLASMNQIRSFDQVSGVLVGDAGCILEAADTYLSERNHIFPLDLGAKGSAHIGGLVATNAGGLRLLRYGSLHGTVLGLEVVLPDGTIVNDLQKLRKNNTGFDLKQMFIGSEGVIGLVTGVSIQCPQRSKAVNTAYFGLTSFDHVKRAFIKAKTDLGEILSAFELMDGVSQEFVHETTGKNYPLADRYPFYVLIETSGSNNEHDGEKLEKFLEEVMTDEIVSDGVVAQDETQAKSLWTWREGLPEACAHYGGTYKYDVSIPLNHFYELIEDTRVRLEKADLMSEPSTYSDDGKPVVAVVGWGHMGDSNLHLNVAVRRYDKEVEKVLEPFIYEWIQKHEGSISAEHGLGFAKRNYVQYSRDETSLDMMRKLKKTFDPLGIMNPYKYIPIEY